MSSKHLMRNQSSAKTQTNMVFFDPSLIKAARNIYRGYCNLNVPTEQKPRGIVINRDSHRGQLSFNLKPILLPRECFIPIQQIEAESY
ncbi:MAG: hypothetical protein AAFQ41_02070 [Cyanobacteria bacterium J06623_7]